MPDTVAKVSLLKLEKVPAKAADLREIVRWQIRKTAPFPIEQAVLSISPGARGADGGSEFVVAVSRDDVIHQYEQACLMAGAHAGLVDLSTFGVINSILASTTAPSGDWLLVHVTDTYLTLAVMRDSALLFFRNRGEEEGTLADLIHQTAMYYEDRLNGAGFARVLIAGAARLPGGADTRAARARRAAASIRGIGRSARRRRPAGSHRRVAGTARRARAAGRHADARTEGGVAMLRTNLSTRPFYNERGGSRRRSARSRALAIGLTLFNAYEILRLQGAEPRRAADDCAKRSAGARPAREGAGHPPVDRQGEARRRAGGRAAKPTR